jgi:prevent-host-death family protein
MCYVVYMNEVATVSVRELRQNLSRYLRRVEAGETLDVLSRGRRVARLSPLADRKDPVARLVAEGRARPPRGDLRGLGPPLPARGGMSLSEALAEQRAERL